MEEPLSGSSESTGTPPDDPPDSPPSAPDLTCPGSTTSVRVDITGDDPGCAFGPAPSSQLSSLELVDDGLRLVLDDFGGYGGPTCTIEVVGVGGLIKGLAALPQGSTLIVDALAADRIELSEPQACLLCEGCPCPLPQPWLFVGDSDLAAGEQSKHGVVVIERGADTCMDLQLPCTSVSYGVRAKAYGIDQAVFGEVELGNAEAVEGDDVVLVPGVSRLRVVRASGSSGCDASPEMTIGTAAWAVYRSEEPAPNE